MHMVGLSHSYSVFMVLSRSEGLGNSTLVHVRTLKTGHKRRSGPPRFSGIWAWNFNLPRAKYFLEGILSAVTAPRKFLTFVNKNILDRYVRGRRCPKIWKFRTRNRVIAPETTWNFSLIFIERSHSLLRISSWIDWFAQFELFRLFRSGEVLGQQESLEQAE